MNYAAKYLKYKMKYLNFQQFGGASTTVAVVPVIAPEQKGNDESVSPSSIETADFDLADAEQQFVALVESGVTNLGQHNCGILFVNDLYVIKCVGIVDKIKENSPITESAELRNFELRGYFPVYYTWPGTRQIYHYIKLPDKVSNESAGSKVTEQYALCFIMEKLDDDLTNYLIKTAFYRIYQQGNAEDAAKFAYMYEHFPKTRQPFTKATDESKKLVSSINGEIQKIVAELETEVINLHHSFVLKGWLYNDNKFDNIGYKMIGDTMKLYFLDDEGLNRYDKYNFAGNLIPDYHKKYLNNRWVNSPLHTYGIFGQYSLNGCGFTFDNPDRDDNWDGIYDDIKVKLTTMSCKEVDKSRYFMWVGFRYRSYNDMFVIQKILNRFRLVRFDDYGRHQSNIEYNDFFSKVDIIFDNIDMVYAEVKKIYNIN